MVTEIDPNLTPKQVRQLPPAKRIPYIKLVQVHYPRFEKILDQIRECYDNNADSIDPQCLLIEGDMGVGKTTLLEIIRDEHPRTQTETGMIIPFLMSTVEVPPTVGNFASGLLRDFGDPRYLSGSIGNRMFRAEEFARDCQAVMLGLDEIQHVVDRENGKVVQTVSDRLKNLIKLRHLACILVGLRGEAEQVVDANPQLAGLFPDPVVLEPFSWNEDDPETVKEFRTLLSELEKGLPLNEESHLSSYECAWRIYVATNGVMRFLMFLIREATTQALKQGVESLDYELLKAAFDKKLGGERRGIKNPFVGPAPVYLPPNERRKSNNGKPGNS